MMKIYLRNDSFKTIIVTPTDTARDICAKMAQKLGIEDLTGHLDLISMTKEEGYYFVSVFRFFVFRFEMQNNCLFRTSNDTWREYSGDKEEMATDLERWKE